MSGLPPTTDRNFLARVREFALIARGLAGDPLDSFVTLRDLKKADMIDVRQLGSATSGGTGGTGSRPRPVVEPAIDLTPPPAPSGFQATAGVTQILFETAAPIYRQGHGHARTKIYAAPVSGPLPTFGDAVLYTDFPGNIGVAPFDPASSLRLWATWTSVDGQESEPAGGINGIAAATGLLEDVHIANLAVGKLLAGSLSVGQYIQSADYVAGTTGWRIQTLGGGGAFMEINGGAIIGGLVVGATFIQSSNYVLDTQGYRFNSDGTAQIGGFKVTNDGIQSTNYVLDTTGWRLKNDGTGQIGGFVVGVDRIRSTNYVAGVSGWQLTNAGAFEARSGTFAGALSAASGTFSGALVAATGTFSGTLTAAAIDAVDSINIAGHAVTIPVSTTASSSISLLSLLEQTLATLPTFTSKGGQVVINFGAAIENVPDADIVADLQVKRNGASIYTCTVHVGTGILSLPPVADVPGNGVSTTYTVTITVTATSGATAGSLGERAAYSLETIR